MLIDQAYRTQTAPSGDGTPQVTTIRICTNPLLSVGLEQLLSGTRFAVWEDALRDTADLPRLSSGAPVLFIVDGKRPSDTLAAMIRDLKAQRPAARVVVLADSFDFGPMVAAWTAGADGFCLTTVSRDVLIQSIELVMLGETVVPSSWIRSVLGEKPEYSSADHAAQDGAGNGRAPDPRSHKLSHREVEILDCLKEGAPNKVIARKLNLAEATVKVHLKAILRKIGVGNRTQAAIWAQDHLPARAAPECVADCIH
ncbi:LuxR C-terminal-related transcriptional regulator [Microvirga lenta]|uniref:LuxR C-terminal-related transcriptional regulator n=1 Tax=Microvirga lenta TaxID=2881337 RepID=UPI001CFF98D6|nr:response regulator transcription factor [Microvirga lenta]MCB5176040.1 response regulator transcription factor [Microvirga lenta]